MVAALSTAQLSYRTNYLKSSSSFSLLTVMICTCWRPTITYLLFSGCLLFSEKEIHGTIFMSSTWSLVNFKLLSLHLAPWISSQSREHDVKFCLQFELKRMYILLVVTSNRSCNLWLISQVIGASWKKYLFQTPWEMHTNLFGHDSS